jgi:hypothetical protein
VSLPIRFPQIASQSSSSSVIYGLYNRPKSGLSTKWTQSHPMREVKRKKISCDRNRAQISKLKAGSEALTRGPNTFESDIRASEYLLHYKIREGYCGLNRICSIFFCSSTCTASRRTHTHTHTHIECRRHAGI